MFELKERVRSLSHTTMDYRIFNTLAFVIRFSRKSRVLKIMLVYYLKIHAKKMRTLPMAQPANIIGFIIIFAGLWM